MNFIKKTYFFYLLIMLFSAFFSVHVSCATPVQLYLNFPYTVNPIGEDSESAYGPLNPEAGFDCTTYVETILAQYKQKKSILTFQEHLRQLRYVTSDVDFFTRAHFMEYHWIPNAIKKQFIAAYPAKDIVNSQIKIYLQEWFLDNPFVQYKGVQYKEKVYKQEPLIQASIAYVPVKYITPEFVQSLPDFMVVFFLKNIPRNTWVGQKDEQILVTHMGILMEGQLYHASVQTKKVSEEDFMLYVHSTPAHVGVSFYTITQ